jgi:DNA-binding NarL/FixJ family response regulator
LAEGPRVIKVLVVEDFEPFRRFVCFRLAERPDCQVIAESSDGMEAVQKAGELQPDLILLDIGLPKLNGLAAARQIRKLAPNAKILFVTQESSPDIAQEAFNIGAAGYLVKTDANNLLTAVDTVLDGRQFISAVLSGKL